MVRPKPLPLRIANIITQLTMTILSRPKTSAQNISKNHVKVKHFFTKQHKTTVPEIRLDAQSKTAVPQNGDIRKQYIIIYNESARRLKRQMQVRPRGVMVRPKPLPFCVANRTT